MDLAEFGRILRRSGLVAIAAMLGLAGACPGPVGSPGAAAAQTAGQAERTFDLRIEKGKLAGAQNTVRVKQGDAVRLRLSTDAPVVLHLHGYDIEKKAVPGELTEFRFKAHATGRFPVNLHGAGAGHGGGSHHETPLMYLEVHPR